VTNSASLAVTGTERISASISAMNATIAAIHSARFFSRCDLNPLFRSLLEFGDETRLLVLRNRTLDLAEHHPSRIVTRGQIVAPGG
jgi:hypothetical protein